MRNFENWETQDLEITFRLKKVKNMPLLNNWLDSNSTFDDSARQRIEELKNSIADFADYWNEDELKMQAISLMLDIANFRHHQYTIFSQRTLSATVDGIEIGGRVDFMLASGYQKPIKPYFFIHEYKQETKKGSSDPKAQLLSELVAAQHKNDNKFPLYGCYVVGRYWFFVVLSGKEYSVSNSFNASEQAIYKIISMLRQVKVYIEKFAAA